MLLATNKCYSISVVPSSPRSTFVGSAQVASGSTSITRVWFVCNLARPYERATEASVCPCAYLFRLGFLCSDIASVCVPACRSATNPGEPRLDDSTTPRHHDTTTLDDPCVPMIPTNFTGRFCFCFCFCCYHYKGTKAKGVAAEASKSKFGVSITRKLRVSACVRACVRARVLCAAHSAYRSKKEERTKNPLLLGCSVARLLGCRQSTDDCVNNKNTRGKPERERMSE